jgi:hypothetical protein
MRTVVALLLMLMLTASSVRAQLPTATGQQYALSQAAWKVFVPTGYTPQTGGKYDLLVHFHGDSQTVWNNAKYADLGAVIVTVNYSGLSSAYSTPFSSTSLFQQILNETNTKLASLPAFGAATSLDHLSVSSFSAGYGAVQRILAVPSYFNAIDSLLAADSLYATTAGDGTPLDSQMVNYKAFATAAAAGDKRFIFTHSQVETYTYESTKETGDELLSHLNLATTPTNATGLGDLRFYRTAERGGFSFYGALGATGDDHLSHLRYIGEWLGDLQDTAAPQIPGDYTGDGLVNAADYTKWRDTWSRFNTDLSADGNDNGAIDTGDYAVWSAAYGNAAAGPNLTIPEPTPLTLVVAGAMVCWRRHRAGRHF